jgi:radical SAM superfamily enzyme
MYENDELKIISMDEYVDRAVLFLEYLSKNIGIQRLVSRAPKEITVFCNWDTSWWKVKDKIEERLEEFDTYQGAKANYLGGIEYGK